MDLTNLNQKHSELISYMEAQGYSKSYICMVRTEVNRILLQSDTNTWNSYLDIYLEYKCKSRRSYIRKATVLGLIARFDVEGLYPNGRRRHNLWKRTAYEKLLPEFKGLVDFYNALPDLLKLREKTVSTNSSCVSNFLLSLQEMGCVHLSDISETHVLKYFSEDGYAPNKSSGQKNRIRAVLSACVGYSSHCIRIASFCPPIHNRRKNIQYVTEGEIASLKSCIGTDSFSKRDSAIISLLIYTGLRACDIAGLTFFSLDWISDRILIRQQKTDIPLELPLSPIIGNAIFDYLREERPSNDDTHIFLGKICPHTPLTPKGIGALIGRCMKAAGIRQKPGDRKGSHIFRHHAVTSMLGKGIPRAVISKAMGHTAGDSIEPYFYADFPHLKECSLSIEKYPVREEVFIV